MLNILAQSAKSAKNLHKVPNTCQKLAKAQMFNKMPQQVPKMCWQMFEKATKMKMCLSADDIGTVPLFTCRMETVACASLPGLGKS